MPILFMYALAVIFSRVLRDSTPRFVGPSVGPSVHRSIGPSVRPSVGRSVRRSVRPSHFTFFLVFAIFGLTAPALVIK